MSDKSRIFGRGEGCADTAAYALGALEPVEVEAFERHLNDCEACAQDLAGYEQLRDALAMTAPEYPVPPGLRRRVIGAVRSEAGPRAADSRRRRAAPMSLLSRSWPTRATLAAAAAIGLVALVFATATLASGGSDGARVLQTRVSGSAGSAQMRLADGRAELIVRDFPAPAPGDIYEVWLKRPGRGPEPTRTLFSVSARGAGDIGVPAALKGVDEILVTEEPAGGTLVPTHPPLIVARLS